MAAGGLVAPSETSLFQDDDRQLSGRPLGAVLIIRTFPMRSTMVSYVVSGVPRQFAVM